MQTLGRTPRFLTPEEMEYLVGERLKRLRVNRNLDQVTVSKRAGNAYGRYEIWSAAAGRRYTRSSWSFGY